MQLKKETIINFVKNNEGIHTLDLIGKYIRKHDIKPESVKNHIYKLKRMGYLQERKNRLFSSNPFDSEFLEILKSKSKIELNRKLAKLNDKILEVVGTMSPHTESRLRYLLMESLIKAYRGVSK